MITSIRTRLEHLHFNKIFYDKAIQKETHRISLVTEIAIPNFASVVHLTEIKIPLNKMIVNLKTSH